MPQSDVPGEKTSPTQPFPTKPPAYARNFIKIPDDLIDFTPEMRAQAHRRHDALSRGRHVHSRRWSAIPTGCLGAINLGNASGGTNWPGAGYDPETHIVYAQAQSIGVSLRSRCARRPQGFSDIRYVSGRQRPAVPRGGRAGLRHRRRCSAAPAPSSARPAAAAGRPRPRRRRRPNRRSQVQGLSARETALRRDLRRSIWTRARSQWQVPYGETPDNVRNHPALKGMNIRQHRPGRQRRDCWSPRRW